jgi:glutamyl-tRNA reductase
MVVGEPQILGQVKEAFAVARASGTVAGQLEHLLQSAFAAAKKGRSETEIGSNSVSIASVAVDLARKIFGSLQGRTVFLVGAGKMSELAARHLVQQGAGAILVTNRTLERARRWPRSFRAQVIPFEELYEAASQADIVISSTGAPHPSSGASMARSFCSAGATGRCSSSTLPCRATWTRRWASWKASLSTTSTTCSRWPRRTWPSAAARPADAETLIAGEVERFQQRQRTVNVAPAIVALQRQAEEIRQAELRRVAGTAGFAERGTVCGCGALTRGLVNKFLHPPMQALKQAAREE